MVVLYVVTVERFKGSEVQGLTDSLCLPCEISGIGKIREAIKPELGTVNLSTQTDQMSNFYQIRYE